MFEIRRRCRAGFSLVEILVVMAIIAMLMAMLMPVYDAMQLASQSSVCVNNLRAIGSSFSIYAEMNNGSLPSQYETWGWGYWNEWDTLPAWPSAACWGTQGDFLDYSTGALIDQCGATPAIFSCPSSNMYTLAPGATGNGFGGYWAWLTYKGVQGSSLSYPCTYQFYTPFASSYGGGYYWPDGPFWVNSWGGKLALGNQRTFYSATQYPQYTSSQYPTYVNLGVNDPTDPPVASDFVEITGWAVYYSHGTQLNQSQSNLLYTDGHVDTDVITTNNWFEYDNMWGGCYHFR